MDLSQALRLSNNSRLAFVGAGGKTTAMFQAARLLPEPVIVTCSTHLGVWQADLADHHVIVTCPEDILRYRGQIEGVMLFTGPLAADQRLKGLDASSLDVLYPLLNSLEIPILIEADGSRQKPLKAPGPHEPVIPGWVDTVVVVVGASGLGKELSNETVQRPEIFAQLSGLRIGEVINGDALVRVLLHREGGLKGIPASARRIALINQVAEAAAGPDIFRVANHLTSQYEVVVVADLSSRIIHRVIESAAETADHSAQGESA